MRWIPIALLLLGGPAWIPFSFSQSSVYLVEYMMFGYLFALIAAATWAAGLWARKQH
jgi:hypothetical protein